jgi:integrase
MKSTKKINQITHEYFGLFQTELLQVDFMTFNLTKLSNLQISQLATYFQNLGFNCYLKKAETNQSRQEYSNKNHFQNQFELDIILKVPYQKEIRKQTRANRKRLPKRDPMTAEIYKELIKEAEGPTYLHVRLRLALCLLAVTGVRINELLNIKVSQLKTLTQESWIAIDRSKRGPSNHKAFLTKEGKKIIQDRKKDFQFILLIKEPDAYVFTS